MDSPKREDQTKETIIARRLPDGISRRTIVATIAAAAGGIEPLRALLTALPSDLDVAFVVMVDLSPEQLIVLPDLIARCTAMPVIQVTEATKLEPNHLYLISPEHDLLVADGAMNVVSAHAERGYHSPIDSFFRALAKASGDGFALLLSGSGTSGSVGLKAIKAHGGLVLVQDPTEAAFAEMPERAIANGLADLVLPITTLATRLKDLVDHKMRLPSDLQQLGKDEVATLEQILFYLTRRTNHDFSGYDRPALLQRIGRRMLLTHQDSYTDYLYYLYNELDEVQLLCTVLLTAVTTFFRNSAALQALAHEVIPKLFAGKDATDQLRVWVVGCGSGEEAYTLAMLLLEHAATVPSPPTLQIFASDPDERALALARSGCYPDAIAVDVSPERLARFFVHQGNTYQIKRAVRERLIFSQHSLLRDPPFLHLDLVVCRDLLTHFDGMGQQQLLGLFHYSLQYNATTFGYLLLNQRQMAASAEAIAHVEKFFQILMPDQALLQSRADRQPEFPLGANRYADWPRSRQYLMSHKVKATAKNKWHQQALEMGTPPSILVNADHQVIHLSEKAGRYLHLPGGDLVSDITRLVRSPLQKPLAQALTQTFQQREETFTNAITVHFDETVRQIHLLVRPVLQQESGETQALVFFIDAVALQIEDQAIEPSTTRGRQAEAGTLDRPFDRAHDRGSDRGSASQRNTGQRNTSKEQVDEQVRGEFARLRKELIQTHQQLAASRMDHNTVAEQLYSVTEELRSLHEEYRAANEELQSVNEELQSVNEELQTVNNQLQGKLHEISLAHSDLQNLMAATEVGSLFLDRGLCIRRFTAPVTELFHIAERDCGRPITDLTHRLLYKSLADDARQVLEDLALIEHEIESTDGCTYLVRLRPYRTIHHQIDGVVVTFIEITRHKVAEAALRASEERFRTMADNIAQLAWMTDPSGWIFWYNKRWYEYTGTTSAEVEGWGWQQVHHPDHVDRVVQKVRHHFATGEAWEDLFPLRSKTGDYRWFLSHAFPIRNAAGEIVRWFGTNTDVTEQRETEAALRQLTATLEVRVQERTAQVRELASKLTMSEQEERRRIAQILHDELQQLLYGIQMRMSMIVMDAEAGESTRLVGYANEAYSWLASAIRTTRQITVDVSPPVLAGEGLGEALQWLATQMAEVNGLQVKIVTVEPFAPANGIDQDMRVLLFHIVRELLFNVVKHAATDHATVTIGPMDARALAITVEDEGRGFDLAAAETRYDGGFGLFSVRERLGLFGGQMKIRSSLGKGTVIALDVPLVQPE